MAEGNRPKKRKAGWFVEIDADLKAEFKAYYPTRSAMKRVTTRAIEQAIEFAHRRNFLRYDETPSKPA